LNIGLTYQKKVLNIGIVQDWEPLSSQQRHAASAVEVFRIIEEVDIIAVTIIWCI
jgi:hypothetical protein